MKKKTKDTPFTLFCKFTMVAMIALDFAEGKYLAGILNVAVFGFLLWLEGWDG